MRNNFRINPKHQFSKRLASWTAIFWFVFMGWLCVVLFLAPEAGLYSVYMSIVVSIVMIINIYQYNSNSKTEKTLFAILDRTEMELKLGSSKVSIKGKDKSDSGDESEDNLDEEESEEENG